MCIPLTPVFYYIIPVIIEVYLKCFTESVSLRELGKPNSRAEISSPNSLYLKALKGAQTGSALDCLLKFKVVFSLSFYVFEFLGCIFEFLVFFES